ncbi:MAG: disulfide bond formation protein B [Pseudomonadota bacterium]
MLNAPLPVSHRKIYLAIFAGMCAVILSALAFEHIGGYQPCKLCLQQREPWYLGIPVMAVALFSLVMRWPPVVTRGLLLIVGLILLYSIYLGVHHSGVEWGWWEGPGDCGAVEGGISGNTSDFLSQLEQSVPPSCTDAALRVMGLSFAGWNALMSTVLAGLALFFVFRK